jgi:hypothetical protein
MKKEDLFALIYADNTCYVSVVKLEEVDERQVHDPEDGPWKWPKLILDLKKGTWQQGPKGEVRQIGDGHPDGYGLIGIYDRTNLKHLDTLVWDVREATYPKHGVFDAD